MSAHPRRKVMRRGLTLLELLLALGLIVLVSAMMFSFYDVIMRSRERGKEAVSSGYLARTIAHQIAEEVRSANGFVTSFGPGIIGYERRITIQTVSNPDKILFRPRQIEDLPPPAQFDVRQVQYYLAYDEEETYTYPDGTEADEPLGLVRREMKTLFQTPEVPTGTTDPAAIQQDDSNPFAPKVDLDLLAPEIRYLRFRYFDGVEWVDDWVIATEPEGSLGNSLPQAVEITVGYIELLPPEEEDEQDDEEKEEGEFTDSELTPSRPEPYSRETYTVTVRLPQADSFFGSRMMRAQRHGRSSQRGEP
ncbi:MAG: type II secretion system protein GspJ [Phycisphaerales bacterium]|nr:type II secretion system protein GspJ [Phycisphaerales bacterium]